ncbi:MAG: PKD domain-containing protein [Planctomycetota bacterium]|nr:PKD domain-containing protein [Planctomycetota bacterium]
MFADNGTLIFAADNGSIGNEPWRFVPVELATYAWQLSGSPAANLTGALTPNFSFTPQNQGVFNARVTITIPRTPFTFTDTAQVFVKAVAPLINAGGNQAIADDSTFARSLVIQDPGTDTWNVTIDYADGGMPVMFSTSNRNLSLSHTYHTPGQFTVTVTVTEPNEGTTAGQFLVTVTNVLPQVMLTPGAAVNEGSASTLGVAISDPGNAFANYQLLQVTWVDGSTQPFTIDAMGNATLTHTYADNQAGNTPYAVSVTVRGNDHGTLDANHQPINDQAVAMTALGVNNLPPVINLLLTGVPLTLNENQLGTFIGVATDNDPVTYSWNFGDGLPGLNAPGQVLQKAYGDNQAMPYTVTLFVRDDENAVSQQTFQVTINNVAPVMTAIGNQTIGEGSALVLTDIGTFVDPGLNDGPFMFTINWGDGTSDGPLTATIDQAATLATALSAGSPAMGSFDGLHVYSDDGPQVVTLTVTDKDGAVSSQEQFLVIVTNVAPTVTAAPALPMTILENQQFSISAPIATFTDPEFGNSPLFTYSIDWGDGTQPDTGAATIDTLGSSGVLTTGSIPNTQMHTYADDGTYTVEVSITDENGMGSTNSDSFQIVVANVDPILTANTPTGPIVGGQLVTLHGLFGDVPNDTVEVTLDFGDNIQRRALLNNGAFQLPHVFQNAGPQTVQVVAKDEDQGQTIQMLNLNIVLPDVVVQSATLNGTTASVTYDILNADLSQLVLGFFRSPDKLFNPASGPAPDTQLDQVLLTNALDLTIGTHIKTFNIGTSAADLSLPGVGRSEDDSDYHLLVVADPTDAIFEDDVVNMANPLGMYREDNTAVISGVYQVLVAPATTASVFIHGTLGNDTVTAQAGGLAIDFNGVMHNFAMGTVADIRARAHGGDDALDLMTIMQSAFVLGADGIDMIWGTNADDVLFGGNGNDFLLGNLGDDELHGDVGNDDLMGSGGNDDIHPGLGNDMAKGQGGSGDVLFADVAGLATLVNTSLTQPTETDTFDMFERAELTGGSGNDTIDASMFTVGPVKLDGAAGDDVLLGTTFNDELIGGPTANVGDLDEIRQTTGVNQTLTNTSVTGQGTDVLTNIDRAMLLISGSSDVTIDSTGFSGDVTAFGGNGNDKIFLGPGNDFASGSAGDDEIHGGSGNDSLNGAAGLDMLFGDAGNDVLKGQGASDTLGGGLGDDVIDGGGSSDMLFDGGDANLTLTNSSLIGIGTDTLISIDKAHIFGGPSPNTLDASAFVSSELTVIDGAGGGDILFGTNGFDVLTSTGNDMMVANGGDDFVFAGSGKDTIFGGAGEDRLFGQGGSGDLIFGGPDKDSISGGTGDDILSGGDGNDLIFGDAGNDIMNGGAGNDNLFGNDGNDGQSGYTGNDFIVGGAGNDLLVGHDGNDFLQGNAGLDTLVGGGGTSIEGDGPDMLDGGADADQIDGLQSEIVNSDPLDTIAAFMNFPSWVDLI